MAETKEQTILTIEDDEIDSHKILQNASKEIKQMNNRLAKLFRSSKNSHVELQAGNNYEFDLAGDNEFSFAKVNLNYFPDGIKFSIKPDKN